MIDALTEAAVRALVEEEPDSQDLVRMLAVLAPEMRALHICVALTLAANEIERTMAGVEINERVNFAYRQAALIGSEVAALELTLGQAATCLELLADRERHP